MFLLKEMKYEYNIIITNHYVFLFFVGIDDAISFFCCPQNYYLRKPDIILSMVWSKQISDCLHCTCLGSGSPHVENIRKYTLLNFGTGKTIGFSEILH